MTFRVIEEGNGSFESDRPMNGLDVLSRDGRKMRSIVAWRVNRYLRPLSWEVSEDCSVSFVDTSCFEGKEVYRRTLTFLLVLACRKALGREVVVRHSLSDGYYCETPGEALASSQVEAVRREILDLVARDLPVTREVLSLDRARTLFENQGNRDKAELLRWIGNDPVETYRIGDRSGFFYGPLAPSTGSVEVFDLVPHAPGMVLRFPTVAYPAQLPPFQPPRRLSDVFLEYAGWLDILGISTMESLHRAVASGRSTDLVLVSEALHSQRLNRIAEDVVSRERCRLVCIAGPSGSGKTTTSHRLAVQLAVCGKRSKILAMDDYFLERSKTPRDAEGNYDFESIEALDLDLLNRHIADLLEGKAVMPPRFDFLNGTREPGVELRLEKGEILVIEGIHGLNDQVGREIPDPEKFRVYLSPLTGVNLDRHNRTSTTDNRLLRRLVRDYRTRGKKPEATLLQWPSVIRGATRHIFPYQEKSDAMFNSALVYELSVLKGYAEPLLRTVREESAVFGEAARLLDLLRYAPFIPADNVPNNSILREFIGGSCFRV
jgi:uridine kinase